LNGFDNDETEAAAPRNGFAMRRTPSIIRTRLALGVPDLDERVYRLHTLGRHGRFAIHERDSDTFRNREQCLEIHRGGRVSTKAYWLCRDWDYFIRHPAGAEPRAYRISDIPLDLEARTEALEGPGKV
jgi:hypothetical protein